jgi:dimeric dUTPase (all-alpha-NTP-PPase superfamily)
MELTKLFQTQKVLRDRIGYNEPDRFDKLILALLVELGELANEQRSWKFWSKDQTPRTRKARGPYVDLEDAEFYNPLLEEYVDGLHVILDLGIDLHMTKPIEWFIESNVSVFSSPYGITEQFGNIYECIMNLRISQRDDRFEENEIYEDLFYSYVGLGEMLGFTWEEVEQAYYAKNAINHHRQEVGY